jgi:hypothetical protein
MSDAVSDGLFWLAVAMCAIAQCFILRAVLLPEPPPPAGSPAAAGRAAGRLRSPSRPLEVAWALLPAIGLALLFAWAWRLRHPVVADGTHPPAARAEAPA